MNGHLPNSLERCAPILGYDPQAYIYDTKSRLDIPKPPGLKEPLKNDGYEKKPENKVQNKQEPQINTKKGGWNIFGKIITGGIIAGATVLGIKRCKPDFKLFKSLGNLKNTIAEKFQGFFKKS